MAETPVPPPSPPSRTSLSAAFLLALVILGFVAVSAAKQVRPGPRLAGKTRLVDLIRVTDERTSALRKELDRLNRELSSLQAGSTGHAQRVAAIRRQADALAPYVGLAAVRGPGIRVELRDSSLQESPTGDPNDLVIHEQDLQAVVNALWTGGAEGIAVNGERVTALSAIRCVGNTLLLHGSVYSPPYRISAVGDTTGMEAALDADEGVERLQIVAERFKLGFDTTREPSIELPAFRGISSLRFAHIPPSGPSGSPR